MNAGEAAVWPTLGRARCPVPGQADLAASPSLTGFAVLSSNQRALEAVLAFAQGRRPFVAIRGVSGWGKTQLSQIALDSASESMPGAELYAASAWLRRCGGGGSPHAVILDDLHRADARSRVERRVRSQKPTLCFLSSGCDLRAVLPSRRPWCVEEIGSPNAPERVEIVRKMCERAGIPMGHDSASLVARLVRGDGHSLQGAVSRLRAGCDGAPMNPVRVAGLLNPYLQSSEIDLRDIVVDSVAMSAGCSLEYRDASKMVPIAVYTLRSVGGLCEESVASYFGLTRGDVYRICGEVRRRLQSGDCAFKAQLDRILWLTRRQLSGN